MVVVHKVVCDAIQDQSIDSHIYSVVHLEVAETLQLALVLLLHAFVLRKDDSGVALCLVQILRKASHYICQASCLYERNALRRNEQYFLH